MTEAPMAEGYRWDPAQYDLYASERGRPFHDLLARVRVEKPRRIVDLGCGPGSLTRGMAERWTQARVTGVDSSADMIEAAEQLAIAGRLDFMRAALPDWEPDGPLDLLTGNAVLQWLPGHLALIPRMARWLAPGGALAFQVPDNFRNPSHVVVREVSQSARWRDRLGQNADRTLAVERPETYLDALLRAGLTPDVWRTTYLHLLPGDDAVLEWIKGTALRPALDSLRDDPEATAEFLAECGERLRVAYPRGEHGTVYPFPRTFLIGHAVETGR